MWQDLSGKFGCPFLFGQETHMPSPVEPYYEDTKILHNLYLQGKMGKTERNGKKITQLKWPKYQKPKDENMGWTKPRLCNLSVLTGEVEEFPRKCSFFLVQTLYKCRKWCKNNQKEDNCNIVWFWVMRHDDFWVQKLS